MWALISFVLLTFFDNHCMYISNCYKRAEKSSSACIGCSLFLHPPHPHIYIQSLCSYVVLNLDLKLQLSCGFLYRYYTRLVLPVMLLCSSTVFLYQFVPGTFSTFKAKSNWNRNYYWGQPYGQNCFSVPILFTLQIWGSTFITGGKENSKLNS